MTAVANGPQRLSEWWLDGGGYDGDAEAKHLPCGTEIPIKWGETVTALLERLGQHVCPSSEAGGKT